MRYGPLLGIDDAGLLLEGKARLLSMPPSAAKPRPSVGEDHERLLALLAVAYRQPISADVLRHVEAASAFWERGEKALANLRLLYAGLPRVDDPTIVRVFASPRTVSTAG